MSMTRRFYPELEGIRGYAFVLVFFTHYLEFFLNHQHLWTYPLRAAADMGWIAVSVFFVLSGFLITGILLRTRDRENYFKTFYIRRSTRVFPLYFTIILILGLIGLCTGNNMTDYWTNLFYLQNLWPGVLNPMRGILLHGVQIPIGHFWSLAVEEQFYLVWPVVIWICRTKRGVTSTCFFLIAISMVVRFYAPVLGLFPLRAYSNTLVRMDAIVFGALLALFHEDPIYKHLERIALPLAGLGLGVMLAVFTITGASQPFGHDETNWRVVWMVPLVDVTAAAIVVETTRQGSTFNRLCQWKPMCSLGSMSYGAYAFHLLYWPWFLQVVVPSLLLYLPFRIAIATMLALSFGLTLGFAKLSLHFIEKPGIRLKERFTYGPRIVRSQPTMTSSPALGKLGVRN